jgi:type I restriction enzyme S subunit
VIDTEALRSKILTFAMHGELSEQKDSDGAAIPKEMKVELLPESDKPHTIPDNWAWVRINEIISKDLGGGTPSKSVHEYWDNGSIPWATVKDFSSAKNGVLSDTIDHITQNGLDNSASNMADEDAIIVCMRMALGKVVRFSKPMAINQDLRALWLKPFVDQDFFVYYYQTLKIEGRGMTVSGIRKNELMNYPFPVPPLAEQIRIVKIVDELFNVLATIDGLQARYTSDRDVLKGKLIDAAICGKLTKQLPEDGTAEELYQQIQEEKKRLEKEGKLKKSKKLPEITEDEIPFDIPANWKWVRICDIFDLQSGKNITASDIYDDKTSEHHFPCYGGNGLRGFVSESNRCGDFALIGRQGALCGNINFAHGDFYATEHAVVVNHFGICDYKWTGMFLNALNLNQYATATAQPGLAVGKINKVLIPLPPLNEQERIVNCLDSLFVNL